MAPFMMFRVTKFNKVTPVTAERLIGTEFNGGNNDLIGVFACHLSRGTEGTTKI
jgi:hypothetical protein